MTQIQTFAGFGMTYNLNFIGQFIKILIEAFGSIGVGIIMFTVILKLITLPLDIYSRVSTKKMALKQEAMKPELEKLQRQYANNKQLYQQKMAALYKKQGVSMLSSCLPMIVTIAFFIIVINAFTKYSNYTNLTMINDMAASYTKAIVDYREEDGTEVLSVTEKDGKYEVYLIEDKVYQKTVLSENGIVKKENGKYYPNDVQKLGALVEKYNNEKGFYEVVIGGNIVKNEDGTYSLNIPEGQDEENWKEKIATEVASFTFDLYIDENIRPLAREAAAKTYNEEAPKFLWVKNLWVPDLPWKHPVLNTISEYKFTDIGAEYDSEFAEITYNLSEEKKAPNGYLILVVLSIGVMVVSQLIMTKSQKTQMELSSVNGQGAQTQKMMMWMMPVMFGVFAFIYNASFSLYMIISSALSTVSTVIINKIVEIKFKKKAEEEAWSNDKRFFKK